MANEISTYTHEGMELPFEDWSKTLHSFNDLASIIQSTHDVAQSSAVRAINRMQTMRNWLIGYYIVEFEQHGKDRAEYGTQLLKKLEERVNRKGLNVTLFQTSRNFYGLYPQMGGLFVPNEIYSTLSNKLGTDSSFISELADSKTKTVKELLKTLGLDGKVLFVTADEAANLYLATRNLGYVYTLMSDEINCYDLVNADYVVMEEAAVKMIEEALK